MESTDTVEEDDNLTLKVRENSKETRLFKIIFHEKRGRGRFVLSATNTSIKVIIRTCSICMVLDKWNNGKDRVLK